MLADATSETVWVHGHAGQLQASTGFAYERLGYFLRLKADMEAETWLHYAVPLALGLHRPVVTNVLVQLRTWATGEIGSVHLWDGSVQLAAANAAFSATVKGPVPRRGEPDRLEVYVSGLASDVPISRAVGVSLLVRAYKTRDAVAIAGVGVTTSTRRRAAS
jgi:hypothetical protein